MEEHSSKAAYLHGSFGSGKSHFTAVLHAMLDGHQAAILGGYVHHVREHRPEMPIPQVYRAQGLLDDARGLRKKLGDEQFLAGLPQQADAGWGDLGQAMTAEKLDEGFEAPIGSDASNELIAKVIEAYFPSYVDSVRGAANAFIPLDQGLSAISKHAKGLGYDGVVLFLDELVLWLAGKIGDLERTRVQHAQGAGHSQAPPHRAGPAGGDAPTACRWYLGYLAGSTVA